MKLLTLVRHAKSDWNNDLSDFNRPLNKRGMLDAPIMGKIASEKLPIANLMISSTALRAKTTAIAFAKSFEYEQTNIQFIEKLYHCGINEYLEVLEKTGNNINHIYLFSHNPGTTNFVNYLCDENLFTIPSCGVSHIKLSIESWNEITRNSGELKYFLVPKMFKKNT